MLPLLLPFHPSMDHIERYGSKAKHTSADAECRRPTTRETAYVRSKTSYQECQIAIPTCLLDHSYFARFFLIASPQSLSAP